VNDELKTLKQQLATLTGEKEQQSSAAKTLEQRLASLESALQTERAAKERLEVATTKKLPPELAGAVQQLSQVRFPQGARLAEDDDFLPENHQGRNRADLKMHGDALLYLGVHLGEDNVFVAFRDLVEHRRE